MRSKAVLITGASAGIGAGLARELARRGARLLLTARRPDRLQELAAELGSLTQVVTAAADVTRDGDLEAAVATGVAAFGGIDVAIANAGFSVTGPLTRLTTADYRRQFETNFFGVLRTIYAALPQLKLSRGRIAVIGSVSGHLPAPFMSPYVASKFALRGLCESVHDELAPRGITVTLISPGFVVSDIGRVDNLGVLGDEDHSPAPGWLRMPTAKAARQIADAITARRREAIITGHGKAGVWIYRHLPILHRAVIGAISRRRLGRAKT
ncbi:MAG TPA: SDR family NAD(P)-dependent oxidoreductase [Polyangia bacterium]|nr:SDR family NAD(P)-dependent oxidoreductase [Polyangia bacterium]